MIHSRSPVLFVNVLIVLFLFLLDCNIFRLHFCAGIIGSDVPYIYICNIRNYVLQVWSLLGYNHHHNTDCHVCKEAQSKQN